MQAIPVSTRNVQREQKRRKLLSEKLDFLPAVLIPIIQEYATTRLLYWGTSGAISSLDAVRIFDVIHVTAYGQVLGMAFAEFQSGSTATFDLLKNRKWHKRMAPEPTCRD